MFDQPFYNRLKEFAAMYGYEEEGGEIHDLFDRSRKNLCYGRVAGRYSSSHA